MLNEYLEQLKEKLVQRNVKDSDEIVAYFEEMISDHLDNGEDLLDILNKLGDPEKVAESFGESEESVPVFKDKETETLHYDSIHSIDIDTVSYSYEFLPSEDSAFHICYEKDESASLNISSSHSHHGIDLQIEQDFSEFSLGTVLIRWADRKNRKTSGKAYLARIYVPFEQRMDLEIDNVSGDLSFKDIRLADVEIDNVSGRISMDTVAFQSLECNSVSGKVFMKNLNVEDDLEIDTTSAAVQADIICCEEIEINTVSADVDISVVGRKEDADIEISRLRSSESYEGEGDLSLSIHTISGKIHYSFTEDISC